MKGKILILALFVSLFTINAQKFAYVDTEYILNNIPSYKSGQEQINKLSENWQNEVEELINIVEKLHKDYQTEKLLLSDELKKKREDEIALKNKEVKELQKKYFGSDGMLFKKREELIKPIQEEVYKAIREVAAEGGFAIIFDTSAGPSVVFSDPKFDKSDAILIKLGYRN